MKTFLTVIVIGIVITAALYLKHRGTTDIVEKKGNAFAVDTISHQPIILSPQVFIEAVGKDSDHVAEIFQQNNFRRVKHNNSVLFQRSSFVLDTTPYILTQVLNSLQFQYIFPNRNLADEFFNRLKEITSNSINYSDSSGNYPAYKLENCMFVDRGYRIANEGYTIEIFDSSLLHSKKAKPLSGDNLAGVERDENGHILLNDDKISGSCLDYEKPTVYLHSNNYKLELYYQSKKLYFSGQVNYDDVYGVINRINDTLSAETDIYLLKFLLSDNCKKLVCYYKSKKYSSDAWDTWIYTINQ